ncbi:uncharacterized protein TNCV_1726061 [Trichonephila clavipes]|nr:uncharacterized protein TNCV_1726061 [Trichonephila clavipes]
MAPRPLHQLCGPCDVALSGLEPGTMQLLDPGEDIKFSEPSDVGGSYEAFMREQRRLGSIGKKKIDTVIEKITSVEEKLSLKFEESVGAVEKKAEEAIYIVEEKIERIQEHVEERIKEEVEERIEGVAESFSLISKRMDVLEKKLLAGGNENKSKSVHVFAFPEPVHASPLPVIAFTGPVKLSTYDGKTNCEVYKTQFSIISEANGWTEEVKACQLATYLRAEAVEVLQTLTDTE